MERVISTGKRRHPVLYEKAVSAAATRTCEMAKGTYFGGTRYRPFDQDLRTYAQPIDAVWSWLLHSGTSLEDMNR